VTSTEGADNLDGLLDDLITGDIAADSTKKPPVEDDLDDGDEKKDEVAAEDRRH